MSSLSGDPVSRSATEPDPLSAETPQGIFIGGCDRSGTTLVQSLISAHPDVLITYEANLPVALHGRFGRLEPQAVTPLIDRIVSHPLFEGVTRDAVQERLGSGEPTFARVIQDAYVTLANFNGKTVWGDKYPKYARRFDFLASLFPACALIHIYRDPRAVANSLIQKPWGPNNALDAAEMWCATVRSSVESFRRLPPRRVLSICYESLVTRPEQEIERLCAFLGLQPHPAMWDGNERLRGVPERRRSIHPAVDAAINTDAVARWSALPQRDIGTIEAICGELMDELGYEQQTGRGGTGITVETRMLYGIQRRWRTLTSRLRS